MRLIVGLGNPGKRYRDTPHNAGFRVCDRFAERHHLGDEIDKFRGRFWRGRLKNEDVAVLKPQTYMNLSGESVREAIRYLPLEASQMIVVYDEIDLPLGRLRIRPCGGSGGHNGVQSLIEQLGTRDFPRIRVGVGRGAGARDPTGHLLGRVRAAEREVFAETVERAADALETVLEDGVDEAMNRFNGLLPVAAEEEDSE